MAVANNTDLLAVDVPAGSQHVTVEYWPRMLTLGFWLSGLSAIGIAVFFLVDWRKRRHGLASNGAEAAGMTEATVVVPCVNEESRVENAGK